MESKRKNSSMMSSRLAKEEAVQVRVTKEKVELCVSLEPRRTARNVEESNEKLNGKGVPAIPRQVTIVEDNDRPIYSRPISKKVQKCAKKSNGNSALDIPKLGIPIADGTYWYPPRMPPGKELRSKIWSCGMPFVKQLTMSDIDEGQNRLMFTSEYAMNFLIPMLKPEESMNGEGIAVNVYDLKGYKYPMSFRIWNGRDHVLTKKWHHFVVDHDFEETRDWVITWMFRHVRNRELCFAVTSFKELKNAMCNRNTNNMSLIRQNDQEPHEKTRSTTSGKRIKISDINGVVGIPRRVISVGEDNEWSPPRLPPGAEKLNNKIGRCSVPFLKKLTSSDLTSSLNRLLMNSKYVRKNLVPMLNPGESLGDDGMAVKAYDLEGKKYSMRFKAWHGKAHVLIEDWFKFTKDHHFEAERDWVVAWMFRHATKQSLCFVITSKRDLQNPNSNRNRDAGSQEVEARLHVEQQSEREEEENDQGQSKRAKTSEN